jgi:hypothetical protein
MKNLDRFEEVAIVALGLLALAGVMSGCGAVEAEMENTSPVDSGGGGSGGGGRVGGRENDTVTPVVGEDVGRRLELLLENLGERVADDFTISFSPSPRMTKSPRTTFGWSRTSPNRLRPVNRSDFSSEG